MALIKSSLLADIRGSIGGTTYSRNRGGSYARNRTVPINPQSPNQVRARSSLSYWSDYWSLTLNDTQRLGWNVYAETVNGINVLGETITYTGQQMFIRSNTLLELASLSAVTSAPPSNVQIAISADPQVPVFDISDEEVRITLSHAFTGTMLAFTGPPQSAGALSVKVPFRFHGFVACNAVTQVDVPTAGLGSRVFSSGQHMACRFVGVTSAGLVSNELIYRGTAQA